MAPRAPCLRYPAAYSVRRGVTKWVEYGCRLSQSGYVDAVVFFLPGVLGGLGPCRSTANAWDWDPSALFPTLTGSLSTEHPVDCYHISWRAVNPPVTEASHSVSAVVSIALQRACRSPTRFKRRRVLFVGHSLGGAIALKTAALLQSQIAHTGASSPFCEVVLGGVVTLAAQDADVGASITKLRNVPKLMYHGVDDTVVTVLASTRLFSAAQMEAPPVRLRLLRECDHGLLDHKRVLLQELTSWILSKGVFGHTSATTRSSNAHCLEFCERANRRSSQTFRVLLSASSCGAGELRRPGVGQCGDAGRDSTFGDDVIFSRAVSGSQRRKRLHARCFQSVQTRRGLDPTRFLSVPASACCGQASARGVSA